MEFQYSMHATSLEQQANKQGLTLQNEAKRLDELRTAINMLWLDDLLTDGQKKHAVNKLNKLVLKCARPINAACTFENQRNENRYQEHIELLLRGVGF